MSRPFEVIVIERKPVEVDVSGKIAARIMEERVVFGPETILAADENAAVLRAGQRIADGKATFDERYVEVIVRPFK